MQIQENYRGIIMGTASNEEIIYGKNAVTEALKAEKPIDTVFVLKGAQGMNQIIALAKKQGIVIKDAGEDKLKALCGDKHGGVAAAWIKIARVSNLVDTIKTLKKHGVWVYGAEADGTPIDKADLSGALALVIGSEGFGLGKLVRENCDVVLSLPMFGKVNSLNASVCAGILMYGAVKYR